MAKKHLCKTHGLECDWMQTSESEEELVAMVKAHAAAAHPQIPWSDEVTERVKAGFTEE